MQYEPMFDDIMTGGAGLAVAIGVFSILVGVLPALYLKERFKGEVSETKAGPKDAPEKPTKTETSGIKAQLIKFFKGFGATLKFKPFLKLCGATFLVFNGFMLISSFQSYVIIYYVFGGDKLKGAEYAGYSGSVSAVAAFVVIFIVTWLATKVGKRKAFFISTGISMVGYALKWFCYNPDYPALVILPAPLLAFGLGGLFTLMGSMIADVVDLDEVETYERREGMFGSIYWWVVKLGMAAALAGGGILLNITGFDVNLEGNQTEEAIFLMRVFDVIIPMLSSGIAIWIIATYQITEEKALEIRGTLEGRHKPSASDAAEPAT